MIGRVACEDRFPGGAAQSGLHPAQLKQKYVKSRACQDQDSYGVDYGLTYVTLSEAICPWHPVKRGNEIYELFHESHNSKQSTSDNTDGIMVCDFAFISFCLVFRNVCNICQNIWNRLLSFLSVCTFCQNIWNMLLLPLLTFWGQRVFSFFKAFTSFSFQNHSDQSPGQTWCYAILPRYAFSRPEHCHGNHKKCFLCSSLSENGQTDRHLLPLANIRRGMYEFGMVSWFVTCHL